MTRQTSHEAYDHLVKNRLLRGKQARIIAWLLRGDYTSGEAIEGIRQALEADNPGGIATANELRSLRNTNAWRARFTELQHRGLIVEVGERRSKETKRRALVWRFTGRTKPLVVKRGRGAKAWKALAIDLWRSYDETTDGHDAEPFRERIIALGGKP